MYGRQTTPNSTVHYAGENTSHFILCGHPAIQSISNKRTLAFGYILRMRTHLFYIELTSNELLQTGNWLLGHSVWCLFRLQFTGDNYALIGEIACWNLGPECRNKFHSRDWWSSVIRSSPQNAVEMKLTSNSDGDHTAAQLPENEKEMNDNKEVSSRPDCCQLVTSFFGCCCCIRSANMCD